jgi:hypothetical protein
MLFIKDVALLCTAVPQLSITFRLPAQQFSAILVAIPNELILLQAADFTTNRGFA